MDFSSNPNSDAQIRFRCLLKRQYNMKFSQNQFTYLNYYKNKRQKRKNMG